MSSQKDFTPSDSTAACALCGKPLSGECIFTECTGGHSMAMHLDCREQFLKKKEKKKGRNELASIRKHLTMRQTPCLHPECKKKLAHEESREITMIAATPACAGGSAGGGTAAGAGRGGRDHSDLT